MSSLRLFALTWLLALVGMMPGAALAQSFSALARILPEQSSLRDAGEGVAVQLTLSQGVPYRVFTLDEPRRVVLDFQEVDWTGFSAEDFLHSAQVQDIRFGGYVPGWSRLVLELAAPMQVTTVALDIDPVTANATLDLQLTPADADDFAAMAGAPFDPRLDLPPQPRSKPNRSKTRRRRWWSCSTPATAALIPAPRPKAGRPKRI